MPISISGRQVVDSNEFQKLIKIKSQLEQGVGQGNGSNLFQSATRIMQQVSYPFQQYEFTFPPSSFSHEGYGVELNEIQRPYSTPIVDPTGGRSLRASFEFVIASRLDGFIVSVDSEIKVLQEFANYGVPVEFINVHEALATPHWYIDNISFSHTRLNNNGQTTAAQCSISLVEYISRSKKMILLPKFRFGKFNPRRGRGNENGENDDRNDQINAINERIRVAREAGDWEMIPRLLIARRALTG